jgi:hypothetical protein
MAQITHVTGKGDLPRNCFSDEFRSNYDGIRDFSFKPFWQKDDAEPEQEAEESK